MGFEGGEEYPPEWIEYLAIVLQGIGVAGQAEHFLFKTPPVIIVGQGV